MLDFYKKRPTTELSEAGRNEARSNLTAMKVRVSAFAPMICSGASESTDAHFTLRYADESAER